ncbi:MAG: GNAT family N-acetyltransferase [Deltaproteobacteria bacterium]|nr:GNAT family N-acetyltransferase [Deltaproteobacteria bacterium]
MEENHTNEPVTIRPMRIEDLAPVFQLGERLFTLSESPSLYRTWDEFEVIDLYRNDPGSCLVAEWNGRVGGFVLATVIDKRNSPRRYGYLVWFGVAESLRGRGIGRRLFAAFRGIMEEGGVRMLLVDTEARNVEALRFFEKCGFSSPRDHVYLSLQLAED